MSSRGIRETAGGAERMELGRAPIGRMLMKLSLPATFAMLVNGLYNLVDTFFIGRFVGTDAIGGLALAFPAQMIVMAVGMAIGQGAASVVSRNLGAGNEERAARAAGNAFAMALVTGLTILAAGLVFMEPLLDLLGATAALEGHARDYLSVILLGSPFIALAMTSNNLLRSEGKAKQSMTVMLIGALTNIALDPLFIYVFDMGVAGAAWATVSGQFLSFLYASHFFLLKKTHVRVEPKTWIPDSSVIRETIGLGIPTFVRQSGMSIVAMLMNNLLGAYGGDIYISSFGVVNRLVMFLFMPMFGMVQGFQPLAGYNYGAKLYGRVRKTLKLSMLVGTCYTTVGFLLLFFFPGAFIRIFTTDEALVRTTVGVMRYVIALFPLMGMQVVGGTYFLAAGKSFPSLVLNLSRQFLFRIPLLLILPGLLGIRGILGSFPIADFLSALVTAAWLLADLKRLPKGD